MLISTGLVLFVVAAMLDVLNLFTVVNKKLHYTCLVLIFLGVSLAVAGIRMGS